jgi:acetyl-CoA C-acetyltransferase
VKATDVYLYGARRLPQGRYGGALRGLGAVSLGTHVVQGLLSDPSLPKVGKVFWGMARSHTQGMNPARTIALKAGLPMDTCGTTINMACGSSLQALLFGAQELAQGGSSPVLVGGSEAMSDTPHLIPGLRWGFRMGHRTLPDVMHQDGLRCPVTGLLMGETIDRLAAKRGISRLEADAYAARSHARAALADFSNELAAHPNLQTDECVRDTNAAALAKLPPVFSQEGQVTAGNASALSDGAAAVLLARPDQAGEAPPLARILGWAEAAVDPLDMGEAPVPAVRRLLAQHGLGIQDIDLWELNEAFAAQVLVCQQQLAIPEDRLNLAGGGIALGHPIGASGARIVVTLVHQLRRRGGGLGIATLGIGGGLGLALLLEVA